MCSESLRIKIEKEEAVSILTQPLYTLIYIEICIIKLSD